MKLLMVHQNFPGQFRDIGPALCDRGHELKAIGCSQRVCDPRIEVLRYQHQLGERKGVHHHSLEVDDKSWEGTGLKADGKKYEFQMEGTTGKIMLDEID